MAPRVSIQQILPLFFFTSIIYVIILYCFCLFEAVWDSGNSGSGRWPSYFCGAAPARAWSRRSRVSGSGAAQLQCMQIVLLAEIASKHINTIVVVTGSVNLPVMLQCRRLRCRCSRMRSRARGLPARESLTVRGGRATLLTLHAPTGPFGPGSSLVCGPHSPLSCQSREQPGPWNPVLYPYSQAIVRLLCRSPNITVRSRSSGAPHCAV